MFLEISSVIKVCLVFTHVHGHKLIIYWFIYLDLLAFCPNALGTVFSLDGSQNREPHKI